MKIPAQLNTFRSDLEQFAKTMESKYGVMIDIGSMNYSPDSHFTTKLTVNNVGEQIDDSEVRIGDTVIVNHPSAKGQTFTVVKINNKKTKIKNIETGQIANASHSMIKKIKA